MIGAIVGDYTTERNMHSGQFYGKYQQDRPRISGRVEIDGSTEIKIHGLDPEAAAEIAEIVMKAQAH